MTTSRAMTKAERDELGRLLRKKAALAKHQAKQRTADLMADFEEKLAAEYGPVDLGLEAVFQEGVASIQRVVAELNAAADTQLEALGVPKRFRGRGLTADLSWKGRGENSTASRRVELRRVAQTAANAAEQRAITEIDTQVIALEERLVRTQLRSHEANRFLEALPTVESLMPPLNLTDVKRLASAYGARTVQERRAYYKSIGITDYTTLAILLSAPPGDDDAEPEAEE